MSHEGHLISDPHSPRYFSMIPHLVVDSGLSHQAIRLYLWYKKVCGQTGQCYQTLDTLAKGCRMNKGIVVRSRRELEAAGFITVKKKKTKAGNQQTVVTIADVWERNAVDYSTQVGTVPSSLNGDEASSLNRVSNKNPSNNNPSTRSKERVAAAKRLPRPDLFSTKFDKTAAGRLRELLVQYDSDLVASTNGRRGVKIETFANSITRLRTEREVPEEQIKAMIKWLKANYTDEYVPKIRKAADLCTNWERFRDAKKRWDNEHGVETNGASAKQTKMSKNGIRLKAVADIASGFMSDDGIDSFSTTKIGQEYIDAALEKMGHSAGSVTTADLSELWR